MQHCGGECKLSGTQAVNMSDTHFKPWLILQLRVEQGASPCAGGSGGDAQAVPAGRSTGSPAWSSSHAAGMFAPWCALADGDAELWGPCCLCSSFPEPAGRFGARCKSIYPPSYTTGETGGSLLILAHLVHLELSSSEKDEADSEWVLPSNGELLASMWFSWAVTKSVLEGWLTGAETEFIQESALVSNSGRNKIDLSF